MSTPLENGYTYKFEVRAELVVDGQTVTQSKVVRLRIGESADINFVAELQVASDAIRKQRASTSQVSLLQ
jgi:subtilase family serine protease